MSSPSSPSSPSNMGSMRSSRIRSVEVFPVAVPFARRFEFDELFFKNHVAWMMENRPRGFGGIQMKPKPLIDYAMSVRSEYKLESMTHDDYEQVRQRLEQLPIPAPCRG